MLKQISSNSRCYPLLILFVLALISFSGCTKKRAELAKNRARKDIDKARTHEAERFNPEKLTEAEARVAAAEQKLAGEDGAGALIDAKRAKELASELLDKTKVDRAKSLKEESSANVRVARLNKANQLDQALNQKIMDMDQDAIEAAEKAKHDKVIALCLQVRADTDSLLRPLRDEAEKHLRDSDNRLNLFKREEAGLKKAPAKVHEAEEKIEEMRAAIETDRNYLLAENIYSEIKITIEQGITLSRRKRSDELLAVLRDKLYTATKEEAEIYNEELLRASDDRYLALDKSHAAGNYLYVLDEGKRLEIQIENLIYETRILAATAAVDGVKTTIAGLESDKVRIYLPSRLDKLDQLLIKAEDEFSQEFYDDCKQTCAEGQKEALFIEKDYNEFTAIEIRNAQQKQDEAQKILDRVGQIFTLQTPQSANAVEQTFENSKQALHTSLVSKMKGATVNLSIANVKRESGFYSDGIETARSVVQTSNYAIRECYHVVAHNNVQVLSHRISQVGKDDGDKYASQEMQSARALLKQSRDMITQQEAIPETDEIRPDAFRASVAKTAEADAAIEIAVQRVTQTAVEKIKEAQASIARADSRKAGVYAAGQLTTALELIQQAQDELSQARLAEATSKADQASRLAEIASHEALKAWAGESLASTDAELVTTGASHTENYSANAARSLDSARAKQATARKLFQDASDTGDLNDALSNLEQSRNLAMEARSDAIASREELITTANQSIVTAKRFDGWQYNYPQLVEAIVYTKTAIEQMEQGNYALSHVYALKASREAKQVELNSKNSTFANRMNRAQRNLQSGSANGGIFFAVEDIRELSERILKIRGRYDVRYFETVSADLDQFETDLYQTLKEMPEEFSALIAHQQELRASLISRGANEFARKNLEKADKLLRYAEMDFSRAKTNPKLYRRAYREVRDGIHILGSVELRYQERAFIDEIQTLLTELRSEKSHIQSLMKLDSQTVLAVVRAPQNAGGERARSLRVSDRPVRFREGMERLYNKSLQMKYPFTMQKEYAQLIEGMALARESGFAFEKFFILDEYDRETAFEIVSKAYAKMKQSEQSLQKLNARFERRGLQGHLASIDPVIGN